MPKRVCAMLLLSVIFLAGCTFDYSVFLDRVISKAQDTEAGDGNATAGIELFSIKDDGSIVAPDGSEYSFVGNEGFLDLVGRRKLIGKIRDEEDQDIYGIIETGLYACQQDVNRVMLLRYRPDSEWGSFYRKKTASVVAISIDNCERLEFVGYREDEIAAVKHISCRDGIANKEDITEFLFMIKSAETVQDVGLYEAEPLENCYEIGKVYGFFTGENTLVVSYPVTSFDDQAYSIMIDNTEYVLPKEYLLELASNND